MLHGVMLAALVMTSGTVVALCPEGCRCVQDQRGRFLVHCGQGDLSGAIPVAQMEPHTQVLRISAPENMENQLTIGPIFQGFQRLEEIHITRSNVPAIGKHTFWGVVSLRLLNLTHNNISQVLDNNFRGLINLRELYLDWNRIESMGSGTFQHLLELQVLSLKGNRIHRLAPRLFFKLANLRLLDLSHNDLQLLEPEVFKDVRELRIFSCRRCNLKNMNPHIFNLLSNLTHLDLGENEFKYLDREEFKDLKQLLSLKLDGNHFPVVLEGTFTSQSRLQHLNLARCQIAKVTNHAFDNMTALLELDLSYNKLDRLEPITFQSLAPNLRSLAISGNNIRVEEFTFVLKVTQRLNELAMADLKIQQLPLGIFSPMESLKQLNLSGNYLRRVQHYLLTPVTGLSSLDLSRNQLHALDEATLVRLESIASVFLNENPWACDRCYILPMMTSNASWMTSVECSLPPQLRGQRLRSLQLKQLEHCSPGLDYKREVSSGLVLAHNTKLGLIAAGASVALLVIAIAAVLAGIIYSRKRTAYYYTNEEKNTSRNIPYRFHKDKKVSIATIDEFTKDSESELLTENI